MSLRAAISFFSNEKIFNPEKISSKGGTTPQGENNSFENTMSRILTRSTVNHSSSIKIATVDLAKEKPKVLTDSTRSVLSSTNKDKQQSRIKDSQSQSIEKASSQNDISVTVVEIPNEDIEIDEKGNASIRFDSLPSDIQEKWGKNLNDGTRIEIVPISPEQVDQFLDQASLTSKSSELRDTEQILFAQQQIFFAPLTANAHNNSKQAEKLDSYESKVDSQTSFTQSSDGKSSEKRITKKESTDKSIIPSLLETQFPSKQEKTTKREIDPNRIESSRKDFHSPSSVKNTDLLNQSKSTSHSEIQDKQKTHSSQHEEDSILPSGIEATEIDKAEFNSIGKIELPEMEPDDTNQKSIVSNIIDKNQTSDSAVQPKLEYIDIQSNIQTSGDINANVAHIERVPQGPDVTISISDSPSASNATVLSDGIYTFKSDAGYSVNDSEEEILPQVVLIVQTESSEAELEETNQESQEDQSKAYSSSVFTSRPVKNEVRIPKIEDLTQEENNDRKSSSSQRRDTGVVVTLAYPSNADRKAVRSEPSPSNLSPNSDSKPSSKSDPCPSAKTELNSKTVSEFQPDSKSIQNSDIASEGKSKESWNTSTHSNPKVFYPKGDSHSSSFSNSDSDSKSDSKSNQNQNKNMITDTVLSFDAKNKSLDCQSTSSIENPSMSQKSDIPFSTTPPSSEKTNNEKPASSREPQRIISSPNQQPTQASQDQTMSESIDEVELPQGQEIPVSLNHSLDSTPIQVHPSMNSASVSQPIVENPAPVQENSPSSLMEHYAEKVAEIQEATAKQIVRGVQGSLGTERSHITMNLVPETLGRIHIQMTIENGSLTTQITADKESTRAMLQQNIASLRTAFDDQGIKVDRLIVHNKESADFKHPDSSRQDESQDRSTKNRSGYEPRSGQNGQGNHPRNRQTRYAFWSDRMTTSDYFI